VGTWVGCGVGSSVGRGVGWRVGWGAGACVGCGVGSGVGSGEGTWVGWDVGSGVGRCVGCGVGRKVGSDVGCGVGTGVGMCVGRGVGGSEGCGLGATDGLPVHVKWSANCPSSAGESPSTTIQYVPGSTMSYSMMEQKKSDVSFATITAPGLDGQSSNMSKLVPIAVSERQVVAVIDMRSDATKRYRTSPEGFPMWLPTPAFEPTTVAPHAKKS